MMQIDLSRSVIISHCMLGVLNRRCPVEYHGGVVRYVPVIQIE